MERQKLIQAGAFTLASVGIALVAKEAVTYIDSWATPKYVLRGNPAPPIDEAPEWQRQTDWKPTNARVYIQDGRNGKTYPTR